MQKKKEKFLEKIVKKDYNNELELVLEQKSFDENTKNILLTVLYKLETAYKDYTLVKQNVMPKDELLQKIIDIIKDQVDEIQIVKINSEDAKILGKNTVVVDKKNKKIITYPIERHLLYALSQISKKDKIIKNNHYFIDTTISDLLNLGNDINTVEPIRDFNGFSWDTVVKEIENLECNLVYQNLRILVGAKFLSDWIYLEEPMRDYYELFISRLKELYGEKIADELVEQLCRLSVLMEIKYNITKIKRFEKSKKDIEKNLFKLNDKEKFIKVLTKEKKDLNKKIRILDTIVSDKKLLQNEYIRRNALLDNENKIFSVKVLANMIKDERNNLIKRLEKINEILNPKRFVKDKNKYEEQYKYLRLIDVQDVDKECEKLLLEFQKIFIDCMKIRIQKANTEDELIQLLFEFRYYLNIPYNKNRKIYHLRYLNKDINNAMEMLIHKLIIEKICVKISNDEMFNYRILKNIFLTKIMDLTNIYIKITKEEDNIYLQLFDENIFDNKILLGQISEIDMQNLNVKLNKNISIFNT